MLQDLCGELGVYFLFLCFLHMVLLSYVVVSVLLSYFNKVYYDVDLMRWPCFLSALFSALILLFLFIGVFDTYHSAGKYECEALTLRITGPYSWVYFCPLVGYLSVCLLFISELRLFRRYLMVSGVFTLFVTSPCYVWLVNSISML